MADTATLEMPGESGGGGGVPSWLIVVGAVAGVVGLVLLLKNSGGGGTTAAGTSINAALGSIQEENMNLLGVTQAGFQQTGTEISSAQQALYDQAASNFNALGAGQQYWGELGISETQQAASRLEQFNSSDLHAQLDTLYKSAAWNQAILSDVYQQVHLPHQSATVGSY